MTVVDPNVAAATAPAAPALEAAAALPAASTQEPAAADPKPAPALDFDHTTEPSLLETVGIDVAAKLGIKTEDVVDTTKLAEVIVAEVKPTETPADPNAVVDPATQAPATVQIQPVTYDDFKLPEGVIPVEGQMEAFKGLVGKYGIPQEAAQQIIDMHINSIKQYDQSSAQLTLQQQHRAFAETRKAWRTAVLSDEQLGGSGHQTAMGAVARMRDLFVPEKDRAEFDNFMRITGAGDHPAFLRLLHNAARRFDEPKYPPADAKPVPQQPAKSGMRGLYNQK